VLLILFQYTSGNTRREFLMLSKLLNLILGAASGELIVGINPRRADHEIIPLGLSLCIYELTNHLHVVSPALFSLGIERRPVAIFHPILLLLRLDNTHRQRQHVIEESPASAKRLLCNQLFSFRGSCCVWVSIPAPLH
jgi:hypothetical protein